VHERERWQVIRAMLKERTLVRIADACRATGASEASIRRDFARLAEQGLAIRVHGGLEAIPDASSAPGDVLSLATRAFDVSQTLNIQAKRAIAKAAVALCADGDTIIVNGGTTTFQMGEFLRERRLKVLTNSYPLAEVLIHGSKCRVALPGGEVYREQGVIVSPFDEDAIQHYSASRMFMSAISIGPLGVIEGDPLLARAESKLLKRADKLVVLADSSKFVSRGSLVVCPLSRIETLITDAAAPLAALDMLREAGVKVQLADVEGLEDPNSKAVA
jgi:DeoR family transcriptional regulator, ulaG and ulaABCDEF operon transcriptional repressor